LTSKSKLIHSQKISIIRGTIDTDIIIISTAHSSYSSEELISQILSLPRCKIFDAVGLFNKKQILSLKDKHEISLIGSGDFT